MTDSLTKFANSLTPEQACRLIQIADPLTPEEQAHYGSMSDDELLAELHTEPTPQGNQYVMPGCEHDQTHGPKQADLLLWTPETARRRVGGTFGT